MAIPNINSAREYTHLQMVKLQSHLLTESKDGGKDEDLEDSGVFYHIDCSSGGNNFSQAITIPTNIVLCAEYWLTHDFQTSILQSKK